MAKKARVPEDNRNFFTVRVRDHVVDANGQRVESVGEIRYWSDRGNDAQMLPAEYAAFCDLMLDKTIRWTAKNADTAKGINRNADLYHWWRAFIEGPLSQVPIGDEQFRKSRAGLIHHTFMNSIRKAANLSPADFKALSLAEVFAVISDIHCRQHNEENAAARRASTMATDSRSTNGTTAQKTKIPRNASRDSQWYDWRHIDGLTDAKIRDKWNAENPSDSISNASTKKAGRDLVKKAIKRMEKQKRTGDK